MRPVRVLRETFRMLVEVRVAKVSLSLFLVSFLEMGSPNSGDCVRDICLRFGSVQIAEAGFDSAECEDGFHCSCVRMPWPHRSGSEALSFLFSLFNFVLDGGSARIQRLSNAALESVPGYSRLFVGL